MTKTAAYAVIVAATQVAGDKDCSWKNCKETILAVCGTIDNEELLKEAHREWKKAKGWRF